MKDDSTDPATLGYDGADMSITVEPIHPSPRDVAEVHPTLKIWSGRLHEVVSGHQRFHDDTMLRVHPSQAEDCPIRDATDVSLCPMSPRQIGHYVSTLSPGYQ